MPWIRDRVDAYDFMKCPHCGAEATIGDFCWGEQGNCCPVCGKTVTCEE
jgi:transposase-like protein